MNDINLIQGPKVGDLVEVAKDTEDDIGGKVGTVVADKLCMNVRIYAVKFNNNYNLPGCQTNGRWVVEVGYGIWLNAGSITVIKNQSNKHKCTCEYYAVLNNGCKCGGE